MKLKFISLTIFLFAFSYCNAQSTKASPDTINSSEKDFGLKDVDYPYPMAYSAKFKFIDPVMSVKSADKGDDWVLVWAGDEYMDKDNVKHRVKYQQVWLLNKEGKIRFMEQFDRDLE